MEASYDLGVMNWRSALFVVCVLLVPTLITWGALRFSQGTQALGLVVVIGVLVMPWVLLLLAQVFLTLAMTCALWRLLRGPHAQDRVLALDTLYVNAMLLTLTFGIREATQLYFEAALVIGVMGFVSTAALAKFLLRGEVIE